MVAVDGKSFGEEVGWVEEGAEVWEDKHALGDSIPEPIPVKIHRLGFLTFDSITGKPYGAFSKIPNSAEGAMGSSRCAFWYLSVKRAACLRKSVGEDSFSSSAAASRHLVKLSTFKKAPFLAKV